MRRLERLKLKHYAAAIGLLLFSSSPVYALRCQRILSPQKIQRVWLSLQEQELLADAKRASVSGVCFPTCVLNIAQAIASVTGRELLTRSSRRLESGVRTRDTFRVIRQILEREIPGLKFELTGKILEAAQNARLSPLTSVRSFKLNDFKPGPNEFKILLSKLIDWDFNFGESHAQVIKRAAPGKLTVIEPYDPDYDEVLLEAKTTVGPDNLDWYKIPDDSIKRSKYKGLAPIGIITVRIDGASQ